MLYMAQYRYIIIIIIASHHIPLPETLEL